MEKNWKDIQHNIDREGGCKIERDRPWFFKIDERKILSDIHTA